VIKGQETAFCVAAANLQIPVIYLTLSAEKQIKGRKAPAQTGACDPFRAKMPCHGKCLPAKPDGGTKEKGLKIPPHITRQ
jgi:hypothetical protein